MAKLTVVEMYEAIISKTEGVLSQGELDFLKQRAELHAKKNASRKPTKAQAENEAIKTKILALLEDGKFYTITEIQKAMGLESNQKTSALVRQLKDGGAVVRSEVKGKAYFAKA
jgi:hypothetical protein